jgi:ABC-2 type transport system ATP-binding protein
MGEPILRAEGLGKSFGRRPALHDVHLTLDPGEFLGLVGPNGAGKTTLLSIASGLLAPDAGSVLLFGLNYPRHRGQILRQLGVVFQSRALDLEISVRAALRFHGALCGVPRKKLDARIDEIGALLDISDLLGRRVRTLSGGNIRRVEIARALLNAPRLVLMDEASTGLDPAIRGRLVAHVRALCRSQEIAVIWSTHLLDELVDADRIVVIQGGHLSPLDAADRGAPALLSAYARIVPKGLREREPGAA